MHQFQHATRKKTAHNWERFLTYRTWELVICAHTHTHTHSHTQTHIRKLIKLSDASQQHQYPCNNSDDQSAASALVKKHLDV